MKQAVYATVVGTDVDETVRWLEAGEAVGVPTETVYGLAANALDDAAVVRIFAAKERPAFNPLIVHAASAEAAFGWAANVPEEARLLAAAFWPGPLTLLLPKTDRIPDLVTAGSDRVGLRVPRHPLLQAILARLPFPLAAPSANRFGGISPTTAQHVAQSLHARIPYVLDGGPSNVGVESSIVGFEDGQAVLYRAGGVSTEALEAVLNKPLRTAVQRQHSPEAPGQLLSHYAPATPLRLGTIADLLPRHAGDRVATIHFCETFPQAEYSFVLSPDRQPQEAAQALFRVLHDADALGVDVILAQPVPESGLGLAINDRLRRAQHIFKGK